MGFINPGKPYRSREMRQMKKMSTVPIKHNLEDILDLIPRPAPRPKGIEPSIRRIKSKIPNPKRHIPLIRSLEALPVDVLYRIFTLVKFRDNNLHLVNRHFNDLFRPQHLGALHIEEMVRIHFVQDLNSKILKFYPNIEQLRNKYRNRNYPKFEQFNTNFKSFLQYPYALDIEVFKYQAIFNLSLDFFTTFFLLDVIEIFQERNKRFEYVKTMTKQFNEESNRVEINYDQLSRTAEQQFQAELTPTPTPGPESDQDGIQPNQNGTQPNQNETNDNTPSYKFEIPIPKFPNTFNNIDSSAKYTSVKILMENLNFKFANVNTVISNLLANKLPVKRKIKIIKIILKNQVVQVNDTVILRAFQFLIHCKYNTDVEAIVQDLLAIFYQTDQSDGELWNFIKETKEVELFHILCGYSNPNFKL